MKFQKLAPIVIAIALFATSCSKQLDVPATESALTSEATVSALPVATAAVATTVSSVVTQKSVGSKVDDHISGFLEALPVDYNSNTSAKYPLIIFCHGSGEKGNGTTDLYKVTTHSIPNLIQNKKFPTSFVSGGKSYSFIVLSPQFNAWPSDKNVNDMIDYAIAHYRVDASRIYIVGLSMGGGSTWAAGAKYTKKVAAIVPMCGASDARPATAQNIAKGGLAVWAFHNSSDPTVSISRTNTWVSTISSYSPLVTPRKTIFNASGHNCWTKASDPNYKEVINGTSMNIYEWMLQYHR